MSVVFLAATASCSDPLGMKSGAITACQILGSPDDISSAVNARLDGATGNTTGTVTFDLKVS